MWKHGVLSKLLSLGFCGHLPIFTRYLLTYRTFRVGVGDTPSPSFDQIEGVPQGSVLSALCFALVINDIITAVPDGVSCPLYVDDFVLYLSGSTLPSAFRRMQLAINRVADWTDSWFSFFCREISRCPFSSYSTCISGTFFYPLWSSSICGS